MASVVQQQKRNENKNYFCIAKKNFSYLISTFISLSVPWTFIKIMEMKIRFKRKEAQGILKDATRPFYVNLDALKLTRLQRFFKLKPCGNSAQKFEYTNVSERSSIMFWDFYNFLQSFSLFFSNNENFFSIANRFLFSMFFILWLNCVPCSSCAT